MREGLALDWHPAFDAVADGVCLLDSDGRIQRANDGLVRLTGMAAESLVGRQIGAVLAGSLGILDLPFLLPIGASGFRKVSMAYALGRRYTLTFEPARDGAGVLVVGNGGYGQRLDEAWQLAERRETEAVELRSTARRMHELERMKSDFLNLASHELRGPLAVLRGYVSMFEDGSLGDLTDSMEAVVPVMTTKLREMNLLISQMLETARLEDSRLVLSRERLDLRDVLAGAREKMQPIAGERHPISTEEGAPAVPVVGDRNRLTMILTNLMDNAIKYSPDGGEVACRILARGGRAILSVSDRGIGIRSDDLGRLFTRFGRVVNADTSHIPGTGLGLYLARELARMHGGDIEVESVPKVGSTFRLVLPLATA